MNPEVAAQQWNLDGVIERVSKGRINSTFLVGGTHILQRINGDVFPNPRALLRNAEKIATVADELVVRPVTSKHEEPYWIDQGGGVWRVYPYVPSRNFDVLPHSLLNPAGKIFGDLLSRLRTLNVELETSIPGFHDIQTYLGHLDSVRAQGDADRELEYVDFRRERLVISEGNPQVIHGDCKVNNVLFDPSTSRAIKVVDLDTLMFGSASWDFGDLLRSISAGREELTKDAHFSAARVEPVIRGFLSAYGPVMNVEEYAAAPAHMSFMLGTRFLTDHFNGDRYFGVIRRGENLDRARAQFALTRQFDESAERLCEVIGESMD